MDRSALPQRAAFLPSAGEEGPGSSHQGVKSTAAEIRTMEVEGSLMTGLRRLSLYFLLRMQPGWNKPAKTVTVRAADGDEGRE